MSSKAWRTVLFPEPERPVRMTSWCASCLVGGFTEGVGSALYATLVGAGDAHVFAVFGNSAARNVNARVIQLLGNLFIGERLRSVFFFNHFFDETLEGEERHPAALGAIHGFAEEGAEFEDALRSVRVLAGDGAADRGRVHANFFGDFFNHHGLERVRAVIEIFALAGNDGLANAQDGVFALLDVFHQLDGRREALLDVVAHVAVGGVTGKQTPVSGAEAELRHVVFVQEDLPLAIHFTEIDVGLDEARFGFVVTQAGPRIELLDDFERALDDLERAVERAGNFFQLVGLHLLQMFGDDLVRESILRIKGLELQQQTLAQITRADADGVEILDDGEGIVEIILGEFAVLDEFLDGGGQIAILIEVADNAFGELFDFFGTDRDAQLPGQVFGEPAGGGEELFEGGPLGDFSFLGFTAVTATVQILVKKTADIELVKGIGFRLLGNLLGFRFEKSFVAIVVALGGFFAELFEDGIGDHLLVDHLAEFEAVEREDAYHLHETGRQNLLLRHS